MDDMCLCKQLLSSKNCERIAVNVHRGNAFPRKFHRLLLFDELSKKVHLLFEKNTVWKVDAPILATPT